MENLIALFNARMQEFNDKTAFCFHHSSTLNNSLTFADLNKYSQQIAYVLAKRFQLQDRILLIFPPGLDLIKHVTGCIYAGCVAVLTYPPTNKATLMKLKYIIDDVQPSAIITTVDIAKKIKISKEISSHVILTSEELHSNQFYSAVEKINASDLALIQYTSGTTQAPRGVMISHGNLAHNLQLIRECYQLSEQDTSVLWLPPYHDMGLIGGIFGTIFTGVTTHLLSPLNFLKRPLFWLQLLSQHKATFTCAPNFAYEYCVRKVPTEEIKNLDLQHLRCALNGAEPIQKQILDLFYESFKAAGFNKKAFSPCYGLAESTLFVASKSCDQDYKLAFADGSYFASVGKPTQDLKIVDQTTQQICSEGKVGEIWLAGESVAQGYWGNPSLTQEMFKKTIDEKSYLNTGDLGFLLDNELYICGRSKDIIIIRGKNYYPQDIEHTVNYCHQLIRTSVAYADVVDGKEEVIIAAEIKEGPASLGLVNILRSIRQAVSFGHDLHVSEIYLLPQNSIPKTTSGKIQRQALKKLVQEQAIDILNQANDFYEPTINIPAVNDISLSLEAALRHLLKLPPHHPIAPNMHFSDLGMDSLLVVELYHAMIENYPQQKVLIEDFIQCKALADVIELFTHPRTIPITKKQGVCATDIFDKCNQEQGFFVSERQQQDHYFAEPILEGPCDRRMIFNNKEMTVWSINDYLGLAGEPRIKQACIEVIKEYSVAYPMGSRLLTGHTPFHAQLEHQLATFVNKESALLCNYGYQGMIGIISSLLGPEDIIVIDHAAHSCIIDAAKVAASRKEQIRIFKHNDMDHLQAILRKLREQECAGILIVTDGVFGMSGETAPLDKLIALKQTYQARLLLDDAHGFGVMGERGRGTGEFYDLQEDIDLYFATFAKSIAGIGGFVAGKREIIDYLKWNSKTTIFSKNLPLIYVKATEVALNIMMHEPERLQHVQHIAKRLQNGLRQLGYDIGKTQSIITPIYLNNVSSEQAKAILRQLREQYQIFVSGVTYPVVELGKLLIRIIPTYKHTMVDVDALLSAFAALLEERVCVC